MKTIMYLFAAAALITSCKNAATNSEAKTDTAAMPYKASFSSSFTINDSTKNIRMVLQSLKDWQDNKLANAPAYFAETVNIDFFNGKTITMKRDSLIKTSQKIRDSLASAKIDIWAYVSLHSNDKNKDFVNVWYTEVDTYKSGKVDSAEYEDDNLIENGKIAYINDKRRTLGIPHK